MLSITVSIGIEFSVILFVDISFIFKLPRTFKHVPLGPMSNESPDTSIRLKDISNGRDFKLLSIFCIKSFIDSPLIVNVFNDKSSTKNFPFIKVTDDKLPISILEASVCPIDKVSPALIVSIILKDIFEVIPPLNVPSLPGGPGIPGSPGSPLSPFSQQLPYFCLL